jgi:hypothetical protein
MEYILDDIIAFSDILAALEEGELSFMAKLKDILAENSFMSLPRSQITESRSVQ